MKYLLFVAVSYILLFSSASAQWKKMNWVDTNYVSAFVAVGDTLFAATNSPVRTGAGIFRSTDNGSNWSVISDTSIIKATTWLIIVGDTMFATNTNFDLLRSTDKGVSWQLMGGRKDGFFFSSLFRIGNLLFSCGSDIFRSTDNGNSWTKTSDPRNGNSAYLSNFAHIGNILFVTSSHGVFRTSNFGDSWTRCDDSTLLDDRIEPIAIKDTNIFLTNIKGYFRSQDTGKTWLMINSMPYDESAFTDEIYFASSGELNYLGGSNQLDISLDGGSTWTYTGGLPDKYISKLVIHNGYLIAALGNGGIWRRRIAEFTGVKGSIPNSVSIQNYPNPFASNTTISFTLPAPSEVSASITDGLGHEITILPPTHYEAGVQHIQWDGSRYPNGIYTCQIITACKSEIRKMVVVR
jgi:hypothetical protein